MKSKVLWQQIKKYKWGSVYIKYLGQLIVLLAVPFTIFVICMFSIFSNNIETEISKANTMSLMRISNSIDMSVQNIYNQTSWLASDKDVLYFLSDNGENNVDYKPNRINDLLEGVMETTSSFIDSVHIYSLTSDNVISLHGGGKLEGFYDNTWYPEYLSNREKSFWFKTREIISASKGSEKVITVFNAIKYMGDHRGVIVVNLDVDALSEFMATDSANIEDVTIYDNYGNTLYPDVDDQPDEKYESIQKMDLSAPYSVVSQENKVKKVTTYIKSEKTGWTYGSSLKLTRYSNQMSKLLNFTYLTIAASILICISLAFYIFGLMVKPVNKILSAIEGDGRPDTQKGINEIDFIVNTISKTISDKQKQQAELDSRLRLLKKAQITAMQAQINPHFLVNILNTIRFMAMKLTKGSNDVTDAITSLLGLYSISLTDSEHFTTVSAEVEHISRYVELQKIRFKDKFDVEFDIQPETMNLSSVKIMLQPIVENAISHGIRPKKGKGVIKIRIYTRSDKLIFEIYDDGVGMSGDEIQKLNEYMKSDYFENFEHIGVKNVNQRLKLIFGDEYGVTVWSKEGEGTKITIIMPVVKGSLKKADG